MILVDTSVWVDHLRSGNKALANLLEGGRVLAHSFVIGEIALGSLRQREKVLSALTDLPHATVATDDEVMFFIQSNALFGRGIGYVDVHLLASARVSDATLWTKDKRLSDVATELGLAAPSI